MKFQSKNLVVLSFLALLAALIPGCQDQEAPRSVLHIVRIAQTDVELEHSSFVLLSDVVVGGSVDEPGTVFEDEVFITIRNDSRSSINPLYANGLFGRIILTEYRIDYDIEDEYLKPLSSSLQVVVDTGEERIVKIVMVSAISKLDPPLSTLAWEPEELLCQAKITMSGYEETSNEKVEVVGYMDIHFANWSDSN